jgi:hypothetical protein
MNPPTRVRRTKTYASSSVNLTVGVDSTVVYVYALESQLCVRRQINQHQRDWGHALRVLPRLPVLKACGMGLGLSTGSA